METITSRNNTHCKLLRKLQQKKYRTLEKSFSVENPRIIFDASTLGFYPKLLLMTESFKQKNEKKVDAVVKEMPKDSVLIIKEEILQQSVVVEETQGVAAIYDFPAETDVKYREPILFLNGVSDPGNAGSIIRSAAAFGVQTVLFDKHSVDPYNPKTISAAKEGIFMTSIVHADYSILAEIKKYMPVFSLDVHAKKNFSTLTIKTPYCLVLGSEAHGVAKEVDQYLTEKIYIPMQKDSVESLNVAMSGSIVLSYFFQQKG